MTHAVTADCWLRTPQLKCCKFSFLIWGYFIHFTSRVSQLENLQLETLPDKGACLTPCQYHTFRIWEDLRFCTVSYFWVLRLPSSSPFCLGISHKAIHGTSISPPAFLQDFCDHAHQTKHSSAPQRLATLETPSTAQLHEEKVNGSRFSEGDPSFHQDVISCCWNGGGSGFAILNPVLKGQIQRPSTYLVLSSIGSSWSHLA